MMTINENTISQSIDYQNYANNRTYDYHHEHPWSKSPYSIYPLTSFDGNFYRQTESTLNYPSTNQFFHNWNQFSYQNYSPTFYNPIPSMNYPLPLPHPPPLIKPKRTRLTARIRSEILKIKSSKPTIFIWEIQQNLIQNGICTSQTLPHASTIQRVLKSNLSIKQKSKVNLNVPSVPISLSPSSSSPTLSTSESQSECSICLDTYCSGQEVSILACSHEYHSSCIAQWMMKNRSCPMCRKDIHNQPQFVTLLI